MISYIWLKDNKPILSQVQENFKSAAILTNPFILMPTDRIKNCELESEEHYYPSHKDILDFGKAISWKEIIDNTGLASFSELAIALKTSISAFKKEYRREDLSDKLNRNLKEGIFYPNEDIISEFIIKDIIKLLSINGSDRVYFSNPIDNQSGFLNIKEINPIEICRMYDKEILLCDENMNYAFMSLYDSFITLLLCKNSDAINVVTKMGWEAIVCKTNTYVDWYF